MDGDERRMPGRIDAVGVRYCKPSLY